MNELQERPLCDTCRKRMKPRKHLELGIQKPKIDGKESSQEKENGSGVNLSNFAEA